MLESISNSVIEQSSMITDNNIQTLKPASFHLLAILIKIKDITAVEKHI